MDNQHNFHNAARAGNVNAVTSMLEANPGLLHAPDPLGLTPIMTAAMAGHVDVVAYLLTHGARIDDKAFGWTSLYCAALYGHVGVIRHLLKAGADPRISDNPGWTPLILAASRGDLLALRCFLGHDGACLVDDVSAAGRTALRVAAGSGFAEVVQALLEAGADPRLADHAGETPLAAARRGYHQECVWLLEVSELGGD